MAAWATRQHRKVSRKHFKDSGRHVKVFTKKICHMLAWCREGIHARAGRDNHFLLGVQNDRRAKTETWLGLAVFGGKANMLPYVSPESTQNVQEDIQQVRKKTKALLFWTDDESLMDLFGAVMGVCFEGFWELLQGILGEVSRRCIGDLGRLWSK